MHKYSWNLGISMLMVFLIYSCRGPQAVDVSDVKVEFDTKNFYTDFLKFDTTKCADEVNRYAKAYPSFFNFYLDTLMNIGGVSTVQQGLCMKISFLLNNKDLKMLADTIKILYPSTEVQTEEIHHLYQYIKHYIPEWKSPNVIYFDGGLRLWSVVMYQDFVAVGLDMFLGKDFPYYASRQVPQYMQYSLEPSQIPVQVGKVIYDDIYYFDIHTAVDFLQMMIESGKRVLFLEYVLPQMKGSDYFALSPEKYQWMVDNEGEIYNYFIRKQMIYSTEMKDNIKYIQEAPYSPGMPTESPGQTGIYIGYRILKSYMDRTKKGLIETIENSDYKAIFDQSKYKPI